MGRPATITISLVQFSEHGDELLSVRREVFVNEQGVPEDIEVDGLDGDCIHALARCGGEAVGVGRMQADGHIGRIAVRKPFRGNGVGRQIMQSLIAEACNRGLPTVYLHSQVQACGFYEALGFVADGETFMEAGIPHATMRLRFG
jgi:predicted GNAT family N-acyltransferase